MAAPDREDAFPDYAHGAAEWKEACSTCKSAVKYILSEVAAILTAGALGEIKGLVESVAAMLSAAASAIGDRPVPAAAHALDVRSTLLPPHALGSFASYTVRHPRRFAAAACTALPVGSCKPPRRHQCVTACAAARSLRGAPLAPGRLLRCLRTIHSCLPPPARRSAGSRQRRGRMRPRAPAPRLHDPPHPHTAGVPTARARVQVLAFVLDAIIPPICSYAPLAAVQADLTAVADQVMAYQASHVTLVPRVAKALEALGPVLLLLPSLTPRVIESFFSLIDRMHHLRGAPVESSDSGPYIKEQRATSKCYYTLATKAPRAFVPYLEAIAQRTTALVGSCAIGYADQNTISEGLLASAASDSAELYARVVAALVAPVRPAWEGLMEELRSPAGMAASMLGPTQRSTDSSLRVGGTDRRSFVYYSLQLLLYCARQAKSAAQQQGYEVTLPAAAADRPLGPKRPEFCNCVMHIQCGMPRRSVCAEFVLGLGHGVRRMQALSGHIVWMLPPAIQLHRCLLGLVQPAVLAGPLAEMQCVLDISPLERASAISQHVFLEAKTRAPELEANRMDPASVHAVRGWIRQCKELVRWPLSGHCGVACS